MTYILVILIFSVKSDSVSFQEFNTLEQCQVNSSYISQVYKKNAPFDKSIKTYCTRK